MKRGQISLVLFIKFDNWYKPPERNNILLSAIWMEVENNGGDPSRFSQSGFRHL